MLQHDTTKRGKTRPPLPYSPTEALPRMTISANVSDKPLMATRGVLTFLPQKPKLVSAYHSFGGEGRAAYQLGGVTWVVWWMEGGVRREEHKRRGLPEEEGRGGTRARGV